MSESVRLTLDARPATARGARAARRTAPDLVAAEGVRASACLGSADGADAAASLFRSRSRSRSAFGLGGAERCGAADKVVVPVAVLGAARRPTDAAPGPDRAVRTSAGSACPGKAVGADAGAAR